MRIWSSNVGVAASGFIATRGGLIVTAAHVVSEHNDAEPVTISLGDGPFVTARVVAYFRAHDIAILEPEQPIGGTPVRFADDQALDVGDELVVYGHPHGNTETITRGIVNAHARRDGPLAGTEGAADTLSFHGAVQTDAPNAPGNSGGPVATRDGRVIGLLSAGHDSTAGFVVPARQIQTALRMVERANGGTIGPWPAHVRSQRVSITPTDRPGERWLAPAHDRHTSLVHVEDTTQGSRITEMRPDDSSSESIVPHAESSGSPSARPAQ